MKKQKAAKIDVSEDAPQNAKHSSTELSRLSKMAERMIEVEQGIVELERQKGKLEEEHERIERSDLPALMDEIGMKEFKLKSGEVIRVKRIIKASLPSESAIEKEKDLDKRMELKTRFEEGIAYLEKNGAGSLVKLFVGAALPKEAAKLAKEIKKAIEKFGISDVDIVKSVHPQTLSAWVKERIEAGKDVDQDLLRVYNGQLAEVITKPGKK